MSSTYFLEQLWPYSISTRRDWEKDITLVARLRIGDFNAAEKTFMVMRSSHFDDSSSEAPLILIPRRYKNGLRLVNAKVSYLQQCARLLSRVDLNGISEAGIENVRLARDSVLRILVFSVAVRGLFFAGIDQTFYNGFAFKHPGGKPTSQMDDNYSCAVMKAWLCCEYHCGRHDPEYVKSNLTHVDWANDDLFNDSRVHFRLCNMRTN
jgi:hypothetical protein